MLILLFSEKMDVNILHNKVIRQPVTLHQLLILLETRIFVQRFATSVFLTM